MFWHNFKYAMRTTLKNKTTLIWTLLFPIALTTFMYMAFGNLFEEKLLDIIPVAVVIEEENKAFETTLEELSEDGDDKILEVNFTEEEEALEQLKQEEVEAISYVAEDIRLKVLGNSYEATVVKTIVEEFDKINEVVKDIAMTNPQAIEKTLENLTADTSYFTKVKTSDGNQDAHANYFYAIFAMSCMFASFISCE